MQRRHFLKGSAALLSTLPVAVVAAQGPGSSAPGATAGMGADTRTLAPIVAGPDRIIEMNVCTRPFRPQGPRIETERIGRKQVVHNYGHGGSGWSLSWGSAQLAVAMAKETGRQEIAVVGCGAIGLTTAVVAQQAGLRVRIYAKERPPYVRSNFATGAWTPDSRICTAEHAAAFAERWESMARYSFRRYQSLLGVAGNPIEWRDMYSLSDLPPGSPQPNNESGEPEYPNFERELIQDITPQNVDVVSHPFPVPYVRRRPTLLFNIASYSRLLMGDFLAGGGRIETYALTDRSDFAAIEERTIINCTGYGARALLADDSIIPVRGQTCKLMPQPELDYGFYYGSRHVAVYPRRDGLLVQAQAEGDFNNDAENLDPNESISAVQRLAEIIAQMKRA
ncbi:MAG: FAD-dependent oxidoreductase [Pseudomonadales bacterium]|nr:FAD-dependent oxidoreductase [Pseudomonadales bacterium]